MLRKQQPRRANGHRWKTSPKNGLLALAKGSGKGQPSKTEIFQTITTLLQPKTMEILWPARPANSWPRPHLGQLIPGGAPRLMPLPSCNRGLSPPEEAKRRPSLPFLLNGKKHPPPLCQWDVQSLTYKIPSHAPLGSDTGSLGRVSSKEAMQEAIMSCVHSS